MKLEIERMKKMPTSVVRRMGRIMDVLRSQERGWCFSLGDLWLSWAKSAAGSGQWRSATGDVAGMFFICQQVSERKEALPAEEPEMRQELPGSPSCPELGERQVLFNNPL